MKILDSMKNIESNDERWDISIHQHERENNNIGQILTISRWMCLTSKTDMYTIWIC